jgi:hypothetical protein
VDLTPEMRSHVLNFPFHDRNGEEVRSSDLRTVFFTPSDFVRLYQNSLPSRSTTFVLEFGPLFVTPNRTPWRYNTTSGGCKTV